MCLHENNEIHNLNLRHYHVYINSFRTESRSQRLGLHTVAYGKPLTAALHKYCYFVCQMGVLLKLTNHMA